MAKPEGAEKGQAAQEALVLLAMHKMVTMDSHQLLNMGKPADP